MSYVHRTIIVRAADQALAQQLASSIVGLPGQGMFTTGLSPTGAGPATHYVSSGLIHPQFDVLLNDANAMYAAAQQAGQVVTLVQCQQLLANSTVQDADAENPFATMVRIGLQMIQG